MAAMTFKEFSAWANARACDGEWGAVLAMDCMAVGSSVWAEPFWRRKKAWVAICADERLGLLHRIELTEKLRQERHKAQNSIR